MIKIYDDCSVYYGNIIDGKRTGKGEQYCFADNNKIHKIMGIWENDFLNGWAYDFYEYKVNLVFYENGKQICVRKLEEKLDINLQFAKVNFKNKNRYYIGDTLNGLPCGFGVMFYLNQNNQIIDKRFGAYLNGKLIKEINEDMQTLII